MGDFYKMKVIKLTYKFLYYLFPRLINSKLLNSYLKAQGIDVGNNTVFFNAGTINVDISRPALLHIGNYCKITEGTIILTHDYSRSVFRRVYGEIIGEARQTWIGDNVFIGINSIILMGTKIGDNCIVGAGSVCSGEYPPNSVIAGNPAKVIITLEDYYSKRKKLYISEAKDYAKLFYRMNSKVPTITDMGAFFPIYLERNEELLKKYQLRVNLSGDDRTDVVNEFLKSKPQYSNYKEFLKDCDLNNVK